MTWKAPTLHTHRHNEVRKQLKLTSTDGIPEEQLPDPVAHCDCGKITTSQMLLDIRNLPSNIKEKCQIPLDMEFICDGCLETIFREGRIPHHDFFKAMGCDNDSHERWKYYTSHYPYPKGTHAHQRKIEDKLHRTE